MNAICIVVDGLHSGFLGCYGNAWVQTPALDRLAIGGFVFDQTLIDSPHLEQIYRGLWRGLHAFSPVERRKAYVSLPALLSSAGISTALVTDEPVLTGHSLSATFGEIVQLPVAELHTASMSDETHLAAVFSAAAQWLEQARQPFCLWLHAQGMQGAWDAPAALRERYAEEENLAPPTFVEPPRFHLAADYDPDQLLGIRWAYAAQVTVLDRSLEGFLEWWDAQPAAKETLLVLLGARGYPLGEHGRVGMAECSRVSPKPGAGLGETGLHWLHEELIHVPCLVRLPGGAGAADRSQALAQPADVAWTLAEWFQLASDQLAPWGRSWLPLVYGQQSLLRDRACLLSAETGEQAIRTPAWYLIQTAGDVSDDSARKIYVKPDDRWEANEVADRCGDVVELLAAAQEEFVQASRREMPFEVTPLADVLVRGLE
jgi:arylsulfatase A-like enzyme